MTPFDGIIRVVIVLAVAYWIYWTGVRRGHREAKEAMKRKGTSPTTRFDGHTGAFLGFHAPHSPPSHSLFIARGVPDSLKIFTDRQIPLD